MLKRGIPVALGTDSIVNLPASEVGRSGLGLSPLAEARHLYQRDGFDPAQLIKMMTVHGTNLLGMPESKVSLGKGSEPAGVIAIEGAFGGDPAARVMQSASAPEFLV